MPSILQNSYVLAVHDIRKSAAWYVDVLGFQIVAEPEGWIFVAKDHCMIMLGECPDDMPPADLGSHNYFAYLRVESIDAYYAAIAANGADLLSVVADKPWGMREFGIRTVDGHRIMIGEEII